jgi:short-subunit dehydrogenase
MEEKVWLVTGSSSGFGKEICKEALKKGDFVIATARKTETLNDLVEEFGHKVLTISLDVTNQQSINEAKEKAISWKDKIDVLVNNAGIGSVGSLEELNKEETRKIVGSLEELNKEETRKIFDVNVFGLVETTRAFLPQFRKQKSGTIVNISSVVGHATRPGFGAYAASKHAVEALSESLSEEVKPLGIKVLIVEPGAFKTSFVGQNMIESEQIEDYNPIIQPTREFMKIFNDVAKGDPNKAAKAIIQVVNNDDDTLRLPLGNDSIDWIKQSLDQRIQQSTQNEDISRGTDFE